MNFSLIVCTYNRADILEECLAALTRQTANPKDYKVIIVNNNSKDHTAEVAQKYVDANSNFSLITEQKQGLSHARNLGYMTADTEWVGYIDDDAKARTNYIERILWVIKNKNFDCFGGIDIPWYKQEKPFWYKDEYFGSRMPYSTIREAGPNRYATGFSMNFKKEFLIKADGFSPDLGMKGDTIAYWEEFDIQMRLKKMGDFKIGYDPELIVDHLVQDYKLHLDWFFTSSFALGRDKATMARKKIRITELIAIGFTSLIFTLWRMIYYTPKLLLKDYYVQNWLRDVFKKTAKRIGIIYTVLKNRGK